MKKLPKIIPVAMLSLFTAGQACAQMATEQYIPIGKSPGLSVSHSDVGHIRNFDSASRTLSLEAGGEIRQVRITNDTRIWLDRSGVKHSNLVGQTSDLATGSRVEVSYVDPARRQSAHWVKVEVGN